MKAVLSLQGEEERTIVQAVRELFDQVCLFFGRTQLPPFCARCATQSLTRAILSPDTDDPMGGRGARQQARLYW